MRGSDQLKQGKLDVAQRAFREALEIDPKNPKVLALLGLTYFRGNQFAEAQGVYETLVECAPTDASHRLNLGLVYLKLGDGPHAIDALEASRSLDPSQGRAVSYLGLAYARAGRYVEAYRSFLMAGQNELATEIEINLTASERDQIQSQLGRTPTGAPPPAPVPAAPDAAEPRKTAHTVSRTASSPIPGQRARTISEDDLTAKAEAAVRSAAAPSPELSSPEITIVPPAPPAPQPSLTESQQFVIPKIDTAVPQVLAPGHSMVSMAVAAAAPSTPAPMLTSAGGTPPQPLSELATQQLVRPDDGDAPFEIAPGGALVMRVNERVMTRLDGVHITSGDLAYEPATRRSRGHQTEERFDYGQSPLFNVTGTGYLIAAPTTTGTFNAVVLDDDILYLREDLVFAFEGTLRWENGNVPGLRDKLPVVQFRGDGALVLRTKRPLVRVKLPTNGVVLVDAERIAGWIGRVIPRAVVPAADGPLGTMCVECTGEGIVLVEPAPPPSPITAEARAPATITASATPSPVPAKAQPPRPPPAAPAHAEVDLDAEDSAIDVDADTVLPTMGVRGGLPGGAELEDTGAAEAAIDRLDEI